MCLFLKIKSKESTKSELPIRSTSSFQLEIENLSEIYCLAALFQWKMPLRNFINDNIVNYVDIGNTTP